VKSISKLVAVLAAALLLAGCSVAQEAGAAVVVGDQRFSVADLSAEYQAALDLLPADSQGLGAPLSVNRAIIQAYVYSVVVDAIAADYDITVTDAQVAAERASLEKKYGKAQLLQIAAQGAIAPQAIDRQLRTSVTYKAIANKLVPGGTVDEQDKVTGPKLVEYATKLGIKVSPRFGEWDPTTIAVVDSTNPLSVSAEALAAAQG
jgi:peptidyl-prolyl cis-trans isomerase SurA